MSSGQIVSLVLLVVVLVLAIWRKANIGLLGFAATFLLVELSGLKASVVFSAFPGSIFTLLVGVSLLFSHLEHSGALRWLVVGLYAAIGRRTQLIPWAGFIFGAFVSSIGALSTAPITLLVPIVAVLSRRYPGLFFINEMALIIGANAAALSPLNPVGTVIRLAAQKANAHYQGWLVWGVGLLVGALVVVVLQFLFRSPKVAVAGLPEGQGAGPSGRQGFAVIRPMDVGAEEDSPLRPVYALASGAAVLAFIGLVVFAGTDVGLTAISLAVFLMLLFRSPEMTFFHKVPWNAVILMCGLLVYLGAMREVGTMTAMQTGLLSITHDAALLIFVVAYLLSLLCNIESSLLGIMSLFMPLVFATFGGSPQISWIVAAISAPAVLSVVSPIHVAGTLVVGFTKESDQAILIRRLFIMAGLFTLLIPGLLSILPALLV